MNEDFTDIYFIFKIKQVVIWIVWLRKIKNMQLFFIYNIMVQKTGFLATVTYVPSLQKKKSGNYGDSYEYSTRNIVKN